ncbi:MAG TPA: HlyD family secretion protein, partial [Nitrospiraceae bacterium]|nr:HlyD family secretion protein [Nitrospiraceae bacterium]
MEENKTINGRRKKIALVVFALMGIAGGVFLYFYLNYKAVHIGTDDAFVDGSIHVIASKISGTVKTVNVKDNRHVKKGDLLLEIEPSDYDVRVKEASAGFDAEKKR